VRAIEVLYELVKRYSPSGHEEEASQALMEIVEKLTGGTVEVWRDGAGNVLASPSKRSEYEVALISHIDTVPGFWEPKIEGQELTGRGAVDAKGPLAAMTLAFSELAERELPVLLGAMVREETDSYGAKYLRDSGVKLRYVIIGEPSNTNGVIIGYRGYAWLEVKYKAKGGHASSPEVGENAIEKLWELYRRAKERLSPATVSLTSLISESAFNVLPSEALARFDVRYPASVELEEVLDAFRGCEVRLVDGLPPAEVKPSSRVPRAIARSLLRMGIRPKYAKKRGTSDMNVLISISESIAAYGPGRSELSHTAGERISEKELQIAKRVYVGAAEELLGTSRGDTSHR